MESRARVLWGIVGCWIGGGCAGSATIDGPKPTPSPPSTSPSSSTPSPTNPQTTPTSAASAALARLDLGVPLAPAFDPDRRWYAVRAGDLAAPIPLSYEAIDPRATISVRMEHVDGHGDIVDAASWTGAADHRLVVTVTAADGGEVRDYVVGMLPDGFPAIETASPGAPSPGWTLLASFDFADQPEAISRTIMAIDAEGVPGWWRTTDAPAFDVRVTEGGALSWIDAAPQLVGRVVDAGYATAYERQPVWVEGFDVVGSDPHEFAVDAQGHALLIGTAVRTEDLSAWGGPTSADVIHNVVQELDASGALLFSWSTVGAVDYGALPASVQSTMSRPAGFEPAHVNSVAIDPADGHWVISMRLPSTVVKVARTDDVIGGRSVAAGEIAWRLGGPASDFAFPDDLRGTWAGFMGQHCARMTGPDQILLFDNGAVGLEPPSGGARMVEYRLDFDEMNAERIHAYDLPDALPTPAGGSVQRLGDGHTLIGWGSVMGPEGGDKPPAITEVDAAGEAVWTVALEANQWTYRAFKAEGDPLTGIWR